MEVENALNFCIKNNLHINEFLILYLTKKNPKLLDEYLEKYSYENKISGLNLKELQERNFINLDSNGIVVTNEFYKLFNIDDLFIEEIYDVYPGFVQSGNKQLAVKAGDSYELLKIYRKRVVTKTEHEEIKKDLEYAIKNNLIQFTITNFINGYYKTIRELRLKGGTNEIVIQNLDEDDS